MNVFGARYNHGSKDRTRVQVDVSFVVATHIEDADLDAIRRAVGKAIHDLWVTDNLTVDVIPVRSCEHGRLSGCDDCKANAEITLLAHEMGVLSV